jgi:ubiquinone/menaquinone biosynthesis C-methylase UbiE
MTASEAYKNYIADDNLSPLSDELTTEILRYSPSSALDYGAGSGKHANILQSAGVQTLAIDISMMNVVRAYGKYDLPFISLGNQDHLRYFRNVDVVFTCSVLDHIEDIHPIIHEFKRIAQKAIVLAETTDEVGEFYYSHDYESYGFEKTGFSWKGEDGATYHIWIWEKSFRERVNSTNDDLG